MRFLGSVQRGVDPQHVVYLRCIEGGVSWALRIASEVSRGGSAIFRQFRRADRRLRDQQHVAQNTSFMDNWMKRGRLL